MNKLSILSPDVLAEDIYCKSRHLTTEPTALIYTTNLPNRYPDCDTRGLDYVKRISRFTRTRISRHIENITCEVNYNGSIYHLSAISGKSLYRQACGLARHLELTNGCMYRDDYRRFWAVNEVTIPNMPEFKIYNGTHPLMAGLVVRINSSTEFQFYATSKDDIPF